MVEQKDWKEYIEITEQVLEIMIQPFREKEPHTLASNYLFQLNYNVSHAFSFVCLEYLSIYKNQKDYFGHYEFDQKETKDLFSKTPLEICSWLEYNTSKKRSILYAETYNQRILPALNHYEKYNEKRFQTIKIEDLKQEVEKRIQRPKQKKRTILCPRKRLNRKR